MGSLMPGWDSPRSGGIEKRKSSTQEEIENFWKIKREVEEEHLKAATETVSTISEDDTLISKILGSGKQAFSAKRPACLEISNSFSDRDSEDAQFVKDEDSLRNKNLTWWTRSKWAFLNEPPLSEMEGPAHKYTAQHHVAMIGDQKQGFSTDVMAAT
ncbi:hypothetical protein SUGI_0351610 [Cryptomeria japonica]|uniref:uncharacterized protein LOC131029472 n=1 Tax=Cryptomeria japonica TaxID=3369 RepID=UPI002408C93B|nr:uncharacterized protein LOC131029472 [Cryptomeria japonica]GLJ19472.1 hypothetical protein SUGI_0351610 [Cryptomeria japonica]